MTRTRFACLLAILVVSVSLPLSAADTPDRDVELELLAVEFEALWSELFGDAPLQPRVSRLSNGMIKIVADIPADRLNSPAFRGRALGPLTNLSNGHSENPLADASRAVNAVISDLVSEYTFWWCASNTAATDQTKNTTQTLTGPPGTGRILRRVDTLVYGSGAITCFNLGLDQALPAFGVYKWLVKIQNGGKSSTKFFAF